MNFSLKGVSFKAKIILLVLVSCFCLGAPTGFLALTKFISSNDYFMEMYRVTLFNDFDANAKSQVEQAVSVLQRLYDRSQKGEITLDEAKKQGADIIRNIHFGTSGYIWADTLEGVNVAMLGKADIEGKNRINAQDKKGKYLIQEINKNAQQPGGGYTDYWFPKPGNDTPLQKRSYSLYFKPFNWVLGTGNYVDDLEALVLKANVKSRKF